MDYSKEYLKEQGITKLKSIAKELGVSGAYKYNSGNKGELAEMIYKAFKSQKKASSPKKRSPSPKKKKTSPKKKSPRCNPSKKEFCPDGLVCDLDSENCLESSKVPKGLKRAVFKGAKLAGTEESIAKFKKSLKKKASPKKKTPSPVSSSTGSSASSKKSSASSSTPPRSPTPKKRSPTPKKRSPTPKKKVSPLKKIIQIVKSPGGTEYTKKSLESKNVKQLTDITRKYVPSFSRYKTKDDKIDIILKTFGKTVSPKKVSPKKKPRTPSPASSSASSPPSKKSPSPVKRRQKKVSPKKKPRTPSPKKITPKVSPKRAKIKKSLSGAIPLPKQSKCDVSKKEYCSDDMACDIETGNCVPRGKLPKGYVSKQIKSKGVIHHLIGKKDTIDNLKKSLENKKLSKTCHQDNNFSCPDNLVCDVDNNKCIPPSSLPKNYFQTVYKGKKIYGSKKALKAFSSICKAEDGYTCPDSLSCDVEDSICVNPSGELPKGYETAYIGTQQIIGKKSVLKKIVKQFEEKRLAIEESSPSSERKCNIDVPCQDDMYCNLETNLCQKSNKEGLSEMMYNGHRFIGKEDTLKKLLPQLEAQAEEKKVDIEEESLTITQDDLDSLRNLAERKIRSPTDFGPLSDYDDFFDDRNRKSPLNISSFDIEKALDEALETETEDLSQGDDLKRKVAQCLGLLG